MTQCIKSGAVGLGVFLEIESAMKDSVPDPLVESPGDGDPWGDAVQSFLVDLLGSPDVHVVTGEAPSDQPDSSSVMVTEQVLGPDGRSRQVRVHSSQTATNNGPPVVPEELSDLPGAALRALSRVTDPFSTPTAIYPSISRALREVVLAEVLADKLFQRVGPEPGVGGIAELVAAILDYFERLAASRHEGLPLTHGVVVASQLHGLAELDPPVRYPGRLPTRKSTPLLFDGTEWVLVLGPSGHALGGFGRDSLPRSEQEPGGLDTFDELPGLDGALTAAASHTFAGVGFYLRSDRSIWVFDNGAPLFVKRSNRWKSIAVRGFSSAVADWGGVEPAVADRVARAAIRLSLQGQGAILALAERLDSIDGVVEPKDRYPVPEGSAQDVDAELNRLIPPGGLLSSGWLARLARVDGATIIDRNGRLLAFGAIVHSFESGSEGARTAAARALSTRVSVAIAVSQDGPITVFVDGRRTLEFF